MREAAWQWALCAAACALAAGCASPPPRSASSLRPCSRKPATDIWIHGLARLGRPNAYGGNSPEAGFD